MDHISTDAAPASHHPTEDRQLIPTRTGGYLFAQAVARSVVR
jgi:hypothetical protein